MFCPHCGKENKDTARFCAGCGKQMKSGSTLNTGGSDVSAPIKVSLPAVKKETMVRVGMISAIVLLFAGIFVLFLVLLNKDNAISVSTAFNSSVRGSISLQEVLSILISGNRAFAPTVISSATGIITYIFIYSIPFFALFSIISVFLNKKSIALYIVSAIITIISSAAVISVTPISMLVFDGFKEGLASGAGVMLNDVAGISFIQIIIFVGIIFALTVTLGILIGLFGKRRKNNDEC